VSITKGVVKIRSAEAWKTHKNRTLNSGDSISKTNMYLRRVLYTKSVEDLVYLRCVHRGRRSCAPNNGIDATGDGSLMAH